MRRGFAANIAVATPCGRKRATVSHAAQLTTHAAPPARANPPLTQTHDQSDGGMWLFMLTAPVSFVLILGAIVYLARISF